MSKEIKIDTEETAATRDADSKKTTAKNASDEGKIKEKDEVKATDETAKKASEADEKAQSAPANDADKDTEKPVDDKQEGETAAEETPLEKAQKEIETLKDRYLRCAAEFDNYRKRTLKEKAELILNGSEKAVMAILPVLDDIERATANAAKTDDPQVIRDGLTLIMQKFEKALEGLGVKKIDTADADFNVDYHEAVAMVPGMGDDKKGKVLDCMQAGYTLNGKVIRHAKVAVGQ